MEIKNDGGSAFPRGPFMYGGDGRILQSSREQIDHGMTLRDWFAGMALNGLLANGKGFADCPAPNQDHYARAAYLTADSMLKEREI